MKTQDHKITLWHLCLHGAILALLAACSTSPVYQRPDTHVPKAFKEDAHVGEWKVAVPGEALQRGAWWQVFGDPTLNSLEAQANETNQNLEAAAARLREARALVKAARSDQLPTINAGIGATRQRASPASQGLPEQADVQAQTLWRGQATVAYEADLFGRVAASVQAAGADAARTEALFRSVQLALQADVAQNYFELRELDTEVRLLRETIALRSDAVRLVTRRFSEGQISELDLARARGELATAEADSARALRLRADAEHRLAILLGKPPSEFSFSESPLTEVTTVIPSGLPSALLERRPDIAAAEQAMAAANARIGVARSAFFPQLEVTGAVGYESATLGQLFKWSSRTFLLGPLTGTALTMPIFDGGRRDAQLVQARARYDQEVANYRQQVLVAFREVEDSLSALRLLADETNARNRVLDATQRASKLSRTQYQEGQVDYLDVIDAQRQVLQAQLQLSQLAGAKATTTVSLIRALGGGWDAAAPN
jgi:multidrug efflux system outer membrane protein